MTADANHSSKILEKIALLNEFHDIVLVAGIDGRRFPAHRCVLAAASDHFRALLSRKIKPKQIKYPGIDGPTCRAIIDYCYTGRITISAENVRKILATVYGMGIESVKQKCCEFLYQKISERNCVATFLDMVKYASDFRQASLDFIAINFEKILMQDLELLSIEQFTELIKSNEIRGTESFIFGRVKLWVEMKDETEIVEKIPNLLRSIRLDRIESKILCEEVEPFFGKQPWKQCVEMVIREYRARVTKTDPDLLERNPNIIRMVSQDAARKIIIHKYNPVEDKWESGRKLQASCYDIDYGLAECRMVIHQNKLFMISNIFNKSLRSIEMNTREETLYHDFTSQARQNTTPISAGKFIYIIGGNGCDGPLSCCERLDTENEKYEKLPSMKHARCFYAAVELAGSIFVAGGMGVNGNQVVARTSVERFSIQNKEWITCASMIEARAGFALVASNGLLYAMGGTDASVEYYDPIKDLWTLIGSFSKGEKIMCAIDCNNQIYAITKDKKFGKVSIKCDDTWSLDLLCQPCNVGERVSLHCCKI